jgi:hypothetical protein
MAEEINEAVLNRVIKDLYLYESNNGKLRNLEVHGETVGDYHVTKEVRDTYKISDSLPEIDQAKAVIKAMRNELIKGGIYKENKKGSTKQIQIAGFDFDSLSFDEQVATLTYVYNGGMNQPKFRGALGHLAKARAGKSVDNDYVNNLAKTAAGFMDIHTADGIAEKGLVKRRLAEKATFLGGAEAVHPEKLDITLQEGIDAIKSDQLFANDYYYDLNKFQQLQSPAYQSVVGNISESSGLMFEEAKKQAKKQAEEAAQRSM